MKYFKPLAFFCFMLANFNLAVGQSVKRGCTKCEAIKSFLSDPEVNSNFSHYKVGVIDSFVIVDMDSSLTKCKISTFRQKPVKLLTSGNLFDSVMKYWWPGLVVDKRKLFKFSMNTYNQLFIQGNGSLFCMARYEIKKGKYFVHRINSGVE